MALPASRRCRRPSRSPGRNALPRAATPCGSGRWWARRPPRSCGDKPASSGARGPCDAPVTTSARVPIAAAAAGPRAPSPAPKRMRAAVANSNRMAVYKPESAGKRLVYGRARPRLREHVADLFHPGQVMRRFLVLHRRVRVAIDLDQDEPRGIVLLLQEVEPGYPRLLGAMPRVYDGCFFESLDKFRFDVCVHQKNSNTMNEEQDRALSLSLSLSLFLLQKKKKSYCFN